jgi:hypothetical protein
LLRHPRLHWLAWAAAAMALLTLTLLSLRPWYDGRRGHIGDLNLPVQGIARAVRAAGIEPATIVSSNKHLAGSLRLAFPSARIIHSSANSQVLPAGPVLLLGSAAGFDALRAQQPGWTDAPATTIEVPYAHARADAPKLKFTFAQAGSPAN